MAAQSQLRNNALVRDAYEAWHTNLDADLNASAPWHEMLKPYFSQGELDGKAVLEVGCGRGDFSCWLARNAGANILGADFSSSAILKARQLAASLQLQLRWEIMDVQSIAHPDNSFDVVISCETIEHLPDPKRAIRELARILRPGGKLFLTTPNYLNLIGLYRGYMRMKGTPYTETGQPINRFVMLPQTLRWIRSAGLGVLTFDSRNLYLPLPGRPWTLAKWLEHPRFLVRWLGFHSLVVAVK